MMDAVEFMDDYGRMCAYYEDCEQFPARKLSKCGGQVQEQLSKIAERWGAESPKKTRLYEFRRLFTKDIRLYCGMQGLEKLRRMQTRVLECRGIKNGSKERKTRAV